MKSRLDALFSRKFVTWIVATGLLWLGKIPPDIWLYLTAAYLGLNVAQKYMEDKT